MVTIAMMMIKVRARNAITGSPAGLSRVNGVKVNFEIYIADRKATTCI